MIKVSAQYCEDGSTQITTTGHASGATSSEERVQVCAAASQAMMHLCYKFHGVWHGNGSGFISVIIPEKEQVLRDFALLGFFLLAKTYPEQIYVECSESLRQIV